MSLGVTITVNTKNAEKMLAGVGQKLKQREYLTLVGQALLQWVGRNFEDEGTEKRWKPLSPRTIAGRRKRGSGARILRDTGRMAMSFVSTVSRTGQWVSVGAAGSKTHGDLARWHHFGTRRVPVRPLLPSKNAGRKIAMDEMTNYVNVVVVEANRGAS